MMSGTRATFPLEPWEIEESGLQPLHIVGVYSNHLLWNRRLDLAKRWIDKSVRTRGAKVYVGEVAHGDRPFQLIPSDGSYVHIPMRARTAAWNKESAANEVIRHLPADAVGVCWEDMDIEHRDPEWAIKAMHALQLWPVIQTWSESLDLGPRGEVMQIEGKRVRYSFGKLYSMYGPAVLGNKKYGDRGHPGYSWAATMDFLNAVGLLLDISGLGAADHQMAMGIVGHPELSIHGQTHPNYQKQILAWDERAFDFTHGRLGYIDGRVEHWFHGKKANRKYQGRWDILVNHQFDPTTDLVRNRWGLIEVTHKKPAMLRDMENYYMQRNEDGNEADEIPDDNDPNVNGL